MSDVFFDRLMRVVIVVIVVLCLGLGFILLMQIDGAIGTTTEVTGYVIGKTYHPPMPVVVSTGKTTTVIVHPAHWDVEVETDFGPVKAAVSSDQFNLIVQGDHVRISETIGRYSQKIINASVVRRE